MANRLRPLAVACVAVLLVGFGVHSLAGSPQTDSSQAKLPDVSAADLTKAGESGGGVRTPGGNSKGYNRWQWFKNTYWIVPQHGIYSIYHSGKDGFAVARGQTVFHITDYFNGYWTGAVTVKLTRGKVPSCQYVLGQVTPQGRVFMTMYDSNTGELINNPTGDMVRKQGRWTMVNQMTSEMDTGGTLSHWAYMVQSRRGDRSFRNLPFARESIPSFMSACPKGPMIKHKPRGV